MKAFLDYVSEITVNKPVKLKYIKNLTIEIYIGNYYIDSLWESENYNIYKRMSMDMTNKLIGGDYSFFNKDTIYNKLLGCRFL